MSKKEEYSLLRFLEREYERRKPSMRMEAGSRDDFRRWQGEFRGKLFELLGIERSSGTAPRVRDEGREELEDHYRERVVIETFEGLWMPAYVLTPKSAGRGKLPAVICLHGHVMAAKEGPAGVADDADMRDRTKTMNGDYGLKVVQRGMIAFAPDVSAFGERLDEPAQGGSVCLKAFLNALLLGRTLLGLRVFEVFRGVDYLRSRGDVAPDKIGCMGLSGGATQTLFAAALDERISAAIVSGYLCRLKDSIFDIIHCACNYVPELANFADMGEVAALVAPRAIFFESGKEDGIFPTRGAVAEFERARKAYALIGAAERTGMDVFEGGHKFCGAKSLPWLEEQLKGKR